MTFVLPSLNEQADRLIELGVHTVAGMTENDVASVVSNNTGGDALLILNRAQPSQLAPLVQRTGKSGFVVSDMDDVDRFEPIESLSMPPGPAYLVDAPERGDEMENWSPDEALPSITAAGRSPLTLLEGIHWLLQVPEVLERGHCFMTIGSRLRKPNGALDTRTPAVWISNGTGRDGVDNRNAPKVGWCWAGNRHTWLGFASAAGRRAL
ncbi:DUF5701 family protein [Rhodococcoides fascians]|uniref:DUF5701 family protein n=1 Tax=Rhodococcoides fascians TaxID=1828 RepID=UPI00055CC30E|nr:MULTISPECIES: DUF5701 family protein [Rhodococcus]OZF04107.1 hypothetical protein CH301_06390 [Rhodococcus sp. 15-1189-1-1a]OZF18783.1 hypothetical protein CH299_06935 [Rhodococcus sp. 14-2686-1-2]